MGSGDASGCTRGIGVDDHSDAHPVAAGQLIMDVFKLRSRLVQDFGDYVQSFIEIRDERIDRFVDRELSEGLFWPDPLIQLNPSFEPGGFLEELCDQSLLVGECRKIFRKDKDDPVTSGVGRLLRLHEQVSRTRRDSIRRPPIRAWRIQRRRR